MKVPTQKINRGVHGALTQVCHTQHHTSRHVTSMTHITSLGAASQLQSTIAISVDLQDPASQCVSRWIYSVPLVNDENRYRYSTPMDRVTRITWSDLGQMQQDAKDIH